MRTCTQPSPKCPKVRPSRPCSAISAAKSRRYAPRCRGGTAASSQPGQAGAPAGVRPPRPAPSSRMRHSARAGAPVTTSASRQPASAMSRSAAARASASVSPAVSTNSQASPRGSAGTAAAPRRARKTSTSRASMPSSATGRCGSSPGTASAAAGMLGVAEHGQGHRLRRRDQPDGRAEDHAERAFGAGQELREIRAVLRQQVLQGVAGHLPGEPAELGADHAEVRRDQGVERGPDRPGGGQAVTVQAPRCEPIPGGGQQVQAHDVVGGAAVPQGARAAGVVADRAADARPRMRGRVRTEPQPVPGRGRGDVVQDRAGLDDRGARLGVDREHPVQVPGEVEHDAGADRVARGGGAAAPAGDRHADLGGDVQRGGRLLDVPGEDDHARHDAVVRRVGGVLGPPPGRVVNLAQPGVAQRRGQVMRRHGRRRHALRTCCGHARMLSRERD